MSQKTLLVVLILLLALLPVACGGGGSEEAEAPQAVGDAARGEELYNQVVVGSMAAPGCVTCHSLDPDTVLVGPSHAGVGTRAATYVEGMSAEDYLHESIVEPNAHLVEGFMPDLMYQNYGEELTARDVNDLVAYMLTLQ